MGYGSFAGMRYIYTSLNATKRTPKVSTVVETL